MKPFSRRDFLKFASAGAVSGYLALNAGESTAQMMGGGGGGGMGGGGSVIDPPVGGSFREPHLLANTSQTPGIVDVSLEAVRTPVVVNGTTANLMTYNGLFPGGTIRARKGDLLRVRFTNSLSSNGALNYLGHPMYVTNLHTHGLHVTPGDNENGTHGDNMLVALAPGDSTIYEYDLSNHYPGTLNFYHPHIHGSVTDQMWAGMSGCLVVEDEVDTLNPYETHLMMLKDITLSGTEPVPHSSMMQYMHGMEGSTVMINGVVNPRLTIKAGQVQRWRVVNSCTARFFRLSLQNHTMYLVGTEGGLLDKPRAITEILLSPGERVDLLIKANRNSGSYKFLSLPYSRIGNMRGQQVTLLTLTYSGKQNQSLPAVVDSSAKREEMDVAALPKKTIRLSMGMAAGYVNGITFVDHEHCYTAMSDLGGWEVWEVINESNMDHPFHHHVNAAQVLSISGGDANYASLWTSLPAWKDVTIVPKWGSIRLLMPVMDYAGMTMFHCHIIEHEDIGMMGMWHIMGMGMP